MPKPKVIFICTGNPARSQMTGNRLRLWLTEPNVAQHDFLQM
jgi:protein-tyrosine-phosphatase